MASMATVEWVLEYLLVALIVVGSVTFSAWRLLSVRLRLRVLDFAKAIVPPGFLEQRVTRFRDRILAQLSSGSGCASCSQHDANIRQASRLSDS